MFTLPKQPLLVFFGSLNLCHGLKRQTSLLCAPSFCQAWGQTGVCLLDWHASHVLSGSEIEGKTWKCRFPLVTLPSSARLLAGEVRALRCHRQALWPSLCFTSLTSLFSPDFLLASKNLGSLWGFGKCHSPPSYLADSYQLFRFQLWRPSCRGLNWPPEPEVEARLGVRVAFCKDTRPLNLTACWLVCLDLLLPFSFLPSFLFSPSPLSPPLLHLSAFFLYNIPLAQIKSVVPLHPTPAVFPLLL